MADPVRAVQHLGGVARWRDLRPIVSRHAVLRAVADGALVRPGHGRYALPELPAARMAAARLGGVVSHESAAAEHGFATLVPPRAVTVSVRPHAHPRPPRLVRLRWSRLAPHEVDGDVTTPLRTVLDCASVLELAEAVAVADSALRSGAVGQRELLDGAAAWAGRRARVVRRVARLADGRAANPFESALRVAALGSGGRFEPQLAVRSDRWVRVDLGDPGLKIALEADSFAWHGSRQALARDCRRYDELVRCGWVVLRFAWEHVVMEPEWVAQVVTDVVADRHLGRSSRTRVPAPRHPGTVVLPR